MPSLCMESNANLLTPVTTRSSASVCDRSLATITSSNPAGCMDVSCECCVVSDRGLCDGLIPLPEKSYRFYVIVCVCVCY